MRLILKKPTSEGQAVDSVPCRLDQRVAVDNVLLLSTSRFVLTHPEQESVISFADIDVQYSRRLLVFAQSLRGNCPDEQASCTACMRSSLVSAPRRFRSS